MRDFGDGVKRPDITIDACAAREAAGLRLAGLAALAGLTSELVSFPANTTTEERYAHLKRVAPVGAFAIVQCGHPGCEAPKSIAAATEIAGTPPAIWGSEYRKPTGYGDSSWVDGAPLVLVQPAGAEAA